MKNSPNAVEKLRIQEGEWIITIPVKASTIKDLKNVVDQLRNRPNEGLTLKPGWRLGHI